MKITSASFVIFIQLTFLNLTSLAQGDSLKNSKKDYSKIFKNNIHMIDGKLSGDTVVFHVPSPGGGNTCTCVRTYEKGKIVKSKWYRDGNVVCLRKRKFIPLLLQRGEKTKIWDENGRKRSWSVSVTRLRGRDTGHWPSNQRRITVTWSHERGKGIHRRRVSALAHSF